MRYLKRKIISALTASAVAVLFTACAKAKVIPEATDSSVHVTGEAKKAVSDPEPLTEEGESSQDAFHIGIVTGSFSQSEDDRRGAEAFQKKYGADNVTLVIYPDNFTEEPENTIQTIVNLSEDPLMKAVIVNQAVDGTTEAFRRIHEKRPDILCIAGEAYEDLADIG